MKNVIKRINIVICLVMLIALIATISFTIESFESEEAQAAVIVSKSSSIDGKMLDEDGYYPIDESTKGTKYALGSDGNYHLTTVGVNQTYLTNTKTFIRNATELVNFINACNSSSKSSDVGILMNDIEYNMQSMGMVNSTAAFYGILDGNGYKIDMWSHSGGKGNNYDNCITCNTSFVNQSKSTPFTWKNTQTFSYKGYYYAGMLCAVNCGNIKNLNIDWNSIYLTDTAMGCGSQTLVFQGTDGTRGYFTGIAGIYCGLLYQGTIYNCSLTVKDSFIVAKDNSGISEVCADTAIVGGFCGNIEANGKLQRSTLYNDGGIAVVTEGGKSDGGGAAWAGGLAGLVKPDDSSARIVDCSLFGQGAVRGVLAYGEGGLVAKQAYGLAGGAVATSTYFTDKDSMIEGNVASGSIHGILSNWTGVRESIWGMRSDGLANTRKTIAGCLFDDVGAAPSNIVLTFDYISLVKAESNALGKNYETLDSGQSMVYGSWTEVYATNNNGEVSIRYDYSKPEKPIRVEAVANDFFKMNGSQCNYTGEGSIDMKISGDQRLFYLNDTVDKLGYFIWSGLYSNVEHGVPSGSHIDTGEDLVGAEIYYISQNLLGALMFTFGESATLEYVNTNESQNIETSISETSKYYDGRTINNPLFKVLRKNGEEAVLNNSAYSMTERFTILNGEEVTDYTYVVTDTTKNYLPGLYTYNTAKRVTYITNNPREFAYYDESSFILVKAETTNPYEYVIYPGNSSLFTASSQSSDTNWKSEDYITISYNNEANTIDFFTYGIGTGAQSNRIEMPENEINHTITIGDDDSYNIHENGKIRLNLKAYVVNPLALTENEAEKYIIIGTTAVLSYVDNQAPVYKNIKYYEYDEDAENKIGFELLEEELSDWISSKVWVVYTISDNYQSGLASGNGDNEEYRVATDDKYECKILLSGETPSVETIYQDKVGNIARRTFSANIDTVEVKLEDVVALNSQEYLVYYANYGYCPVEVVITFTPVFGIGGAYLQYSYNQDEEGNDIWVTYENDLQPNTPNIFVMNFLIEEKNFKMRLVSSTGLYADSYANGDGCVTNGASNEEEAKIWTIKITIAYIGITLDNIIYNGAPLSSQNLSEILTKDYDGTNESSLECFVSLYLVGSTERANTYIVYTDKYRYSRPLVQVNYLKVHIMYDSDEIGNRIASIHVDSVGEYKDKYEVYFNEDDSVLSEILDFASQSKVYTGIQTTILPVTLNINLADYADQLKPSYTYGDNIPTSIFVEGFNGNMLELVLDTDAKIIYEDDKIVGYPNVGTYRVDAHLAIPVDSINLQITKVDINIVAKSVIVETQLDGKDVYSTSISFDGMPHYLTGVYTDVFKEDIPARIEYYTDPACTNLVSEEYVNATGVYYAKLVIESPNYQVINTGSRVQFSIVKGYLDINLDEQIKQYTGEKINFNIIPINGTSDEYYDVEDFTINYYLVNANNQVDLTRPLTAVSDVGRYLVQASIGGNAYFFDREYDDTYITVTKAQTKSSVDNSIEVEYDGANHTISLKECILKVQAAETDKIIVGPYSEDETKIVYYESIYNRVDIEDTNLIEIYFFNINKYVKIDENNPGLFSNVGTYQYRINFLGTDNYEPSYVVVDLVIRPKIIEGITMTSPKFYYVEGTYYSVELEDKETDSGALQSYIDMGATISYTYNNETRVHYENGILNSDFVPFEFTNTGIYSISATIELENYSTFTTISVLTIDKSAMKGIQPVGVTLTYDGKVHYAEFSGFDLDSKGNQKMDKISDTKYTVYYNGIPVTVDFKDDSYATNAGNYFGKVSFTCSEYASFELETNITIDPIELPDSAFDFSELEMYISQIDSDTDLRALGAKFTDINGRVVDCFFEYHIPTENDEPGDIVELDEEGCLAAGKYIILIKFNTNNYKTNLRITITIADADNSGEGGGEYIPPVIDDPAKPTTTPSSNFDFMQWVQDNLIIVVIAAGVVVAATIGTIIALVVTKKKKSRPKNKPKKGSDKKDKKVVDSDEATF